VTVAASTVIVVAAVVGVLGAAAVMRNRKRGEHDPSGGRGSIDRMGSETETELNDALAMRTRHSFESLDYLTSMPARVDQWFGGRVTRDSQEIVEADERDNPTTRMEFLAWLQDSGLESFQHDLNSMGIYSVDDIRREQLDENIDTLTAIGFRKIQIAKLRRALEASNRASEQSRPSLIAFDQMKKDLAGSERTTLPSPPSALSFSGLPRPASLSDVDVGLPRSASLSDVLNEDLSDLMSLLMEAGLERYLDDFSNMGIVTVQDLQRVLDEDIDAFSDLGLRRVQLARLRQALEKPREERENGSFKELKQAAAKGIKL